MTMGTYYNAASNEAMLQTTLNAVPRQQAAFGIGLMDTPPHEPASHINYGWNEVRYIVL